MTFPTLSQNRDPALRKLDRFIETFLLVLFMSVTCLVCCSCGSTRHVTQLVERTSVDTVYLSNTLYDSIYIFKDKQTDRTKDTIYVKDVSVEYRYKLLRDTIYKVQRDSIPYEVTKIVTKEIKRPLTSFDRLCRICFFFLVGVLFVGLVRFVFKPKKSIFG